MIQLNKPWRYCMKDSLINFDFDTNDPKLLYTQIREKAKEMRNKGKHIMYKKLLEGANEIAQKHKLDPEFLKSIEYL